MPSGKLAQNVPCSSFTYQRTMMISAGWGVETLDRSATVHSFPSKIIENFWVVGSADVLPDLEWWDMLEVFCVPFNARPHINEMQGNHRIACTRLLARPMAVSSMRKHIRYPVGWMIWPIWPWTVLEQLLGVKMCGFNFAMYDLQSHGDRCARGGIGSVSIGCVSPFWYIDA